MSKPKDMTGRYFNRPLFVFVVLVGMFCSNFNQTILAVAQPTLMQTFGVTAATAQWLSTGYSLIVGVLTPVTAWLADNYSAKWLFEAAMTFFLIGTTCAFFASSFAMLLFSRLLQAVGGGLLAGIGTTMLFSVYPQNQRGTVSALMGLVFGLAPALGPTFSGWVIDTWNWHMVFGALLPLLTIALLLGFFALRPVVPQHPSHLDWPSVALSVVGFGSLLFDFAQVGNYGWQNIQVIAGIIVGAIGVGTFLLRQTHIVNPVLRVAIFREHNYRASVIVMAISQLAFASFEFVLPLYLQTVRGLSAMTSGLCLVLGALVSAAMSPVAGYALDHFSGKRMIQSGLLIMALGTIPFGFVTPHTPMLNIVMLYTIRSFGFATVSTPVTALGVSSLPRDLVAHGSSGNNMIRFTVSAVGTAILISVQQMITKSHMASRTAAHPTVQALLSGYHFAFLVVFALLVLGLLCGQTLREHQEVAA